MLFMVFIFICYNQDSIQIMKAGKHKELDYLLINLAEQSQKPNFEQAEKNRLKHAVGNLPWTCTGTDQYHRYGPGVSLYFSLLKHLALLFLVLTIISLPSLLVNFNGGGLDFYGSSVGRSLMQFSLANQPSLSFQKDELTPQQLTTKFESIKSNQFILIINDVVCSLAILFFLIYWRIKSEDLIAELIKKQALPSYHTILMELPNPEITQEDLRFHFQKFGEVRQVQFVFNYQSFLLDVKQLLQMIEKYSEEENRAKKEQMYDQIGQNYLKIKEIYQSAAKHNMTLHQHPFQPTMAFVSFDNVQLAHRVATAYKYRLPGMELALKGDDIKVKTCNVQPLSILWQNFHLPTCSQVKRSWLFGFIVTVILLITLSGIFIMSLHVWQKTPETQSTTIDPSLNGTITFEMAKNTTDQKIINAFCSQLTYKTFQWKYYSLCETYFVNFQHHWAFVLTVSGFIVCINLVLIKIVFALAELRRFRTLPEKKRFLTLSIFLTYFFSSSLLAILIRGQITVGDLSISMVKIAKSLFSSVPDIQVFTQATRRWYLYIGKLLIVNYLLTLIICPWLYVIEEWLQKKIRRLWSKMAKTHRQAKQRLLDNEFYWQFYYAIQLNAIFFGLIFSIAMPIFYLLIFVSVLSLFLTSKIIFHKYTREPQVYDHKMNNFMSEAIAIAILAHQLSSHYFLGVEDIFPLNDGFFTSTAAKNFIYFIVAALAFTLALIPNKIASLVRTKKSFNTQELMMTEQINSSFGAKSRPSPCNQPIQKNKKQRIKFFRQVRHDSYLNSYKMQDNPYYNNISYTLLILYQTIIERKQPDIEKSCFELQSYSNTKNEMEMQKVHLSLHQSPHKRKNNQQYCFDTERALNQSV